MKLLNYIIYCISILLLQYANASVSNEQIRSWKLKDDYLVISEPMKIDVLDPIKSMNAHTKFTLPLIFESLITVNAQQELQPVLAKTWYISANGKSLTIILKANHQFSDNTEVTSHDIVHTIRRLCSKHSQEHGELCGLIGCGDYAAGKNKEPEVYVIDKYTVKFNINCSPTTFLYQLSSPSTVITKQTPSGLIGSGPYTVHQKEREYLILKKNHSIMAMSS